MKESCVKTGQTGRFRRFEHIKRPVDFRKLFKNGKKISVSGAKLYFLPNGLDFNRVGFPLPRGFGNAVERNRAKRLSRETYRKLKARLNNGYDMLFLVYPNAVNDSFLSRCVQFQTLISKAGLFSE